MQGLCYTIVILYHLDTPRISCNWDETCLAKLFFAKDAIPHWGKKQAIQTGR